MKGLASGLLTVLPLSSTTVRSLTMSKSVPSNVSRNSSMILAGVTGLSGLTESGKTLLFGFKRSDGANRLRTRHSRRVQPISVRPSGL